jgi:hypothetical protein
VDHLEATAATEQLDPPGDSDTEYDTAIEPIDHVEWVVE